MKPGDKPPEIAKSERSTKKVVLSVWWDCQGVLMAEYLEPGREKNGEVYSAFLNKLRDVVKEKRRGKLSKTVLVHQDNVPAHRSLAAEKTIIDCGFEVLVHPPHSPDLVPSDFRLFPRFKLHLHGTRFPSLSALKTEVMHWFGHQTTGSSCS